MLSIVVGKIKPFPNLSVPSWRHLSGHWHISEVILILDFEGPFHLVDFEIEVVQVHDLLHSRIEQGVSSQSRSNHVHPVNNLLLLRILLILVKQTSQVCC